jgi:hypothetical protein
MDEKVDPILMDLENLPSVLYIVAGDDIQDFDAGESIESVESVESIESIESIESSESSESIGRAGQVLYDARAQKDPPKTPYAEWMPPQAAHRVVNRSKNAIRLYRIEVK